jgi:hypothetical protein
VWACKSYGMVILISRQVFSFLLCITTSGQVSSIVRLSEISIPQDILGQVPWQMWVADQ